MEPIATPGFMTDAIQRSACQIQDFDAVVRLHWPRVFRYALASLRDREAAESLAQDCFLRAYKGRERFRGDSSLTTWLLQIAVNLVRDHARNRRLQFWKHTRDLDTATRRIPDPACVSRIEGGGYAPGRGQDSPRSGDRKSTRLNSSHQIISY